MYCNHFYPSMSLSSCLKILDELNTRYTSGLEFYSQCSGLMIVMSGIQNDSNRKLTIPFKADVVKLSQNIPLLVKA